MTKSVADTMVQLMIGVVNGPNGTAQGRFKLPGGVQAAAKTGTAQKQTEKGMINFAWLIAFAPVEDPRIAIAIAIEGDTPGEETGGGRYASPVAHAILQAWLESQAPGRSGIRLNVKPSG